MAVILTTGLPGSGKSTWAKQHAAQFDGEMVLTSRDDIRLMLGFGPIGTKEQENFVSKIQDEIIVRAVKEGKSIIVHDTNLNKKSPTRIKKLFDGDVDFLVADFTNVPVATCIERDAKRPDSVGAEVIRGMARQLNKPWRLTDEFMNDVVLSPRYIKPVGKPKAVLVDLDGTLAEHVARSPYDYSRVGTDGVHGHIREIVNTYWDYGYVIIGFSGRPDVDNVRKDTLEWADKNNITLDYLYMRPADQLTVNDADVKQFLFDKYIRDNYDVEFMLDDRNRVVRRMRKLGIPVLQVADGEF
ncbi:polynucleotide kinase [Streptomyces phage Alone3]|nr:polynucleotide kinase [Streptomyces phage Alone3]